jgi:hypothetical protein
MLSPLPLPTIPLPGTLLCEGRFRMMIGSAYWEFTMEVTIFFNVEWILSTGIAQYR